MHVTPKKPEVKIVGPEIVLYMFVTSSATCDVDPGLSGDSCKPWEPEVYAAVMPINGTYVHRSLTCS